MRSCNAKTNGLPTAQQSRRKKEEELAIFYLGSAGRSEARYREKVKGADRERWVSGSARLGGGHGGWWQGENRVPWAMLVKGNGGIQRKNVITNSRIPGKKWWKMEKSCPVAAWVSICSTPLRLVTNGHGCWYGDTQK